MSRKAKIIAGVAVLVVLGGVVAAVALGSGGATVQVDIAKAVKQDLAVTVTASGRVESGLRADVFPPTAGTLSEVLVKDGDKVSQGAVLARLDTGPLELQVAQAQTGLAQAESQLVAIDDQAPSSADLAASRQGTSAAWAAYQSALAARDAVGAQAPSAADKAAATAATNAAWSAYSSAKAAYDGLKASVDASAMPTPVALSQLDAANLAKEQAYAGYLQAKAAQDKLGAYDPSLSQKQTQAGVDQGYAAYLQARAAQAKLENTSLSTQRAAAQAGVDQARKALALAQDNLESADLTAPSDGVVLFNALGTPASDGQTPRPARGVSVGPQSAPFTVVDLKGLSFMAEVDEVDVDSIKPDMKGTIALDAFTDRFVSQVSQIKPAATFTATGGTVFPVYFELTDAAANILIGMKGDAQIEIDKVPGATTIPVEALFDEGGTTFVYKVKDGVLKRIEVEVGTLTETQAQIMSGISEGDAVALSGPIELVDGMKVRAKQ
ncbi:MAG: biotin/lipoyl-binding protein [Coriobacteriia bacterium]|nr:biotin/lipoyl-binding protein [Coriobacteriia bacterium]